MLKQARSSAGAARFANVVGLSSSTEPASRTVNDAAKAAIDAAICVLISMETISYLLKPLTAQPTAPPTIKMATGGIVAPRMKASTC